MNEKVVLIGAGSAMFTRGLVSDILRKGWQGEMALVDIDPVALEVAEKMTRKMLEAAGSSLKVSASVDRRDVLSEATVVMTTIGVGGRDAWVQDVMIPRKYGIYQPVGDSVMPGGTSRALRMIPAMVDIAKDVAALAPCALFFNYANPMSAICRGVRKATGIEMIGLCHGVYDMAKGIASRLGATREQLQYTAVGLNHFTWFTDISSDTWGSAAWIRRPRSICLCFRTKSSAMLNPPCGKSVSLMRRWGWILSKTSGLVAVSSIPITPSSTSAGNSGCLSCWTGNTIRPGSTRARRVWKTAAQPRQRRSLKSTSQNRSRRIWIGHWRKLSKPHEPRRAVWRDEQKYINIKPASGT